MTDAVTAERGVGAVGVPRAAAGSWQRMGVVRAVVGKEVRELGKVWGVCWLVVFVGSVYLFGVVPWFFQQRVTANLMGGEEGGLFPLACAGIGLMLGMAGYSSQIRFDAWAFWVHRPMGRGRLFALKSLAGLLVYGMAVGMPIAVYVGVVGMHRGWTPYFHWRMVLPSVADVGLGVAAYFCGAWTAQRKARWLGTKVLPAAAMLPVLAGVMWLRTFEAAMAVEVAAGVVFGLAAWDAAWTHGEHDSGKGWRRVVVAAGMTAAVVPVWAGMEAAADSLMRGAISQGWPIERFTARSAVVLADGAVAWVETSGVQGDNIERRVTKKYFTLEGKPLEGVEEMKFGGWVWTGVRERPPMAGYREKQSILAYFGYSRYQDGYRLPNLMWYYLPHERVVLGFEPSREGWKVGGSLGPSGFRKGDQAPEPFGKQTGSEPLMTETGYYVGADYRTGKVSVVAPGEAVLGVQEMFAEEAGRLAALDGRAVLTPEHVYVYDKELKELKARLALKREGAAGSWSVAERADGEGWVAMGSARLKKERTYVFFDRSGTEERRVVVEQPAEWFELITTSDQAERVAVVATRAGAGMVWGIGPVMYWSAAWRTWEYLGWNGLLTSPTTGGVAVMGLIGMLGMLVVARWHGVKGWRRGAWAVTAGVLGPLMVVVLVAVYARPEGGATKGQVAT